MIFHENRLLADDSHVILYLIFVENWERCRNLSSDAVMIGALRVNLIGMFILSLIQFETSYINNFLMSCFRSVINFIMISSMIVVVYDLNII